MMSDIDKEKLAEELKQARRRVAELEIALIGDKQMKPLSENVFRSFAESATDSISIWDSNMKMVYLNDATLIKYYPPGTKLADVIGKHFTELVPGSVESGRYDKYLNVLNSGAPVYIEEFTPHHRFGDMHLAIRVFKIDGGLGIITIDLTERKRMEQAIQDNQQRLSALIENAPDVIFTYDINGRFISGNKRAEELMGYSREALLGKTFTESGIFTPGSLARASERLAENRKGKQTPPIPFELIAKDGSHIFVEVHSVPITQGDKVEVIAIARDITERKRTEEALRQSEEKFRVIFNSIADGISVIDLATGKLIDTNEAALRMFNFTREDVIGTYGFDLISEKDRPSAMEDFARTLEKGYSGLNEWCLLGKEGTEHDCEATSSVIRDVFGKTIYLVNVMRDISERKRMEEKLRQSEEKLRRIFESIGNAITILNMNGIVVDANETAVRMSGGKREEYIGRYSLDLLAERDRARAIKDMTEAFSTGYSDIKEYTVLRKDGSDFPAETTSTVLCDAAGEPVGLVNILRDISQRKQMEEQLRQSEEKIRQIFNSVGVGISVTDMEGKVVEVNDFGLRLCGCSKEEIIGRNGIRFIAERDRPRIIKEMISAFETGKSGIYEFTSLKKDGTEYETETIATVMRDSSGKPTGLIASVTDITERKRIDRELNDYKANLEMMVKERTADIDKANRELKREIEERKKTQEELRESEERLRVFFENVPDILFAHNMEGQFTDVNKKGLELSGYSRNELVGKNILETGILPPDQIEGVIAGIKGIEDGKSGYPYEVQLAKKNGERMTVEAVSFPMRKKGRLEVMGIAHDITERKKAAEALRASEEKLRAIFEAIEDGIAVADLEGNLIDMNESDIKLFGYERKEQLLNANAFLFVTEADRPRVIRDMSAVLTIGSGKIDRYRLMDKNGNEFDAEVSGSLLRNSQGKPTAIVNIIRDITERKRMEEAIRLSEAKLRAILNNMSDGISVTDMSGCIVDENEPGAKLMGYAGREEVLGLNGFDFIAEVDRARILKELEKSLTRGYGGTYQVKLVDRYGKEFDSELTGSLLSDSSGKPTGLVCVMRDITERKRMEEALKESEAKYRTLVEQSDQGTCILKNGRIVFANKALSKMNGYSLKEMYAMASDELLLTVHPDDRESYANRIKMRIEGKRMRPRHEYRVIRKDGTEIWFETFAKRILYRGQPAIQSTMADITERKQWESNLQQSKSDLSLYLSQINQAQEEERKRIARELHDDTIQEIVALSRQLDNLIDKRIGPEEERRENRRLIEDAQRKVDTILKGIRRFTRDLRPSILDDLGLVPALEWLTTDISEQFKIPIKISIRGKEQHIASDAALVMFRIAQESLRNACRHSGATHIQVELKYASQKVTLSITDNGQGFNPPEDTSNLIRRGKLGVAGMYERAQLIGANLSIKSNKNKGTSVTLEVNIK